MTRQAVSLRTSDRCHWCGNPQPLCRCKRPGAAHRKIRIPTTSFADWSRNDELLPMSFLLLPVFPRPPGRSMNHPYYGKVQIFPRFFGVGHPSCRKFPAGVHHAPAFFSKQPFRPASFGALGRRMSAQRTHSPQLCSPRTTKKGIKSFLPYKDTL